MAMQLWPDDKCIKKIHQTWARPWGWKHDTNASAHFGQKSWAQFHQVSVLKSLSQGASVVMEQSSLQLGIMRKIPLHIGTPLGMSTWKTHCLCGFPFSSFHESRSIYKNLRSVNANWTQWRFGHLYLPLISEFPRPSMVEFDPLVLPPSPPS